MCVFNWLRYGALLTGLLCLASCSTPYSTPERNPENATFSGLVSVAHGGGGTLEVLSVHGMCTHDHRWVEAAAAEFAEFLKLKSDTSRKIDEINDIEIWLTELTDPSGNVLLRNYALVWSKLTAEAKATLCYDVSVPNGSCPQAAFDGTRATLNSSFKSGLLDDCFADAIHYLGPAGATIRHAMAEAVAAVGGLRDQRNPLVIITESLGSKVVTDAIFTPSNDRRSLTAALSNTRIIFMAANQIPLLNLGYRGGIGLTESAKTLVDLRDELELQDNSSIQLIAFSDPNDLLTYELSTETDATTINVRVSNNRTWFGWIANPDSAHRRYLNNPAVWRLISCGIPDHCT